MTNLISDKHNPEETQNFLTGEQRVHAVVTQSGLEDMQADLARLVDEGADAAELADRAVAIWHRADSALSSVFGQQGVSSLFRRSLQVARAKYAWLEEVRPGATDASDFDALRTVLAQREPSLALAAHGWLLKTFCDLLARIIGASLLHKLLQPVWSHSTVGTAAQNDPR